MSNKQTVSRMVTRSMTKNRDMEDRNESMKKKLIKGTQSMTKDQNMEDRNESIQQKLTLLKILCMIKLQNKEQHEMIIQNVKNQIYSIDNEQNEECSGCGPHYTFTNR